MKALTTEPLAEDEDRSFDDLRSGRTPAGSMPLE